MSLSILWRLNEALQIPGVKAMIHKDTDIERRRHPRSPKRLNFKLKAQDFDVVAETKDLSCIGALCQVNKPIPEMTHLKMILELPGKYAECEGTVVRVEKNSPSEDIYNIAIYFNEISKDEKKKIADYLGL
jgi:hypothetical protein